MLRDRKSALRLVETLNNNPGIWFDKNSMAFTIKVNRKTVSRTINKILSSGFILTNGRYFTKNQNFILGKTNQWMVNVGLMDPSNPQKYGWAYYGKYVNSHTGNYHYLLPGITKSVCGKWKIESYQVEFIKFIKFSEITFSRHCGRCIAIMKIRGLDITKSD